MRGYRFSEKPDGWLNEEFGRSRKGKVGVEAGCLVVNGLRVDAYRHVV